MGSLYNAKELLPLLPYGFKVEPPLCCEVDSLSLWWVRPRPIFNRYEYTLVSTMGYPMMNSRSVYIWFIVRVYTRINCRWIKVSRRQGSTLLVANWWEWVSVPQWEHSRRGCQGHGDLNSLVVILWRSHTITNSS